MSRCLSNFYNLINLVSHIKKQKILNFYAVSFEMSFGTDTVVSWLQYYFASTEKHTYWYVPVAEDHSFVETDEGVVFAFNNLNRARAVCSHRGWPGLLELGPRKWKSFNRQNLVRPHVLRKNPTDVKMSSNSSLIFESSKQTKLMLIGILLLLIIWHTFNDMIGGPIVLILFLISRLVSPLLQFAMSFTYIICLLLFGSFKSGLSSILTWAFVFTAVEVYLVFAPSVFVVNIDHINLRDL